jgi:hypothetical protein
LAESDFEILCRPALDLTLFNACRFIACYGIPQQFTPGILLNSAFKRAWAQLRVLFLLSKLVIVYYEVKKRDFV